jgi:hypothetical protein
VADRKRLDELGTEIENTARVGIKACSWRRRGDWAEMIAKLRDALGCDGK